MIEKWGKLKAAEGIDCQAVSLILFIGVKTWPEFPSNQFYFFHLSALVIFSIPHFLMLWIEVKTTKNCSDTPTPYVLSFPTLQEMDDPPHIRRRYVMPPKMAFPVRRIIVV